MSIYHVKNNDPGSLKEYALRHHGKGVNNEAWLRDVLATDWHILYEVLAPVSPHHDKSATFTSLQHDLVRLVPTR